MTSLFEHFSKLSISALQCGKLNELASEKLASIIAIGLSNRKKLFICGNGGSFSQSSHIVAEFVGRFKSDRDPLPAILLGANPSSLTAIANDYGYESVFQRELKCLGNQGDILICLSTSGTSANVLSCLRTAPSQGMSTWLLTGEAKLLYPNVEIVGFPSRSTATIQELHLAFMHHICERVEELLFS